ncbi:MAG: hypothetical protein QGF59_02600 [Pirellulaceae bacterium]|nr:hypothetical protein [Pirellulaceae bacterium]
MKTGILTTLIVLLGAASAHSASLSDGAGLNLTLAEDGTVNAVRLSGRELARGVDGGFYLREPNSDAKLPVFGDLAKRDGAYQLTATSPLRAQLDASWTEGDGFIEIRGELTNLTDTDRGLWLGFNVPLDATGWKWGKSLSNSATITASEGAYTKDNNLIPIPAVWNEEGGVAICVPPTNPCVFEVAADAEGLRIQMAFGLSEHTAKFPSKARFCFRVYSIDGAWGFRDALEKYYDWYPEYYSIEPWVMKALDHHHDWIGANYVAEGETEAKTDHLINPRKSRHMAYTKTSGRIQGVADVSAIKSQQQVLQAIASTDTVQHYCKNAPEGSRELTDGREALINSVCGKPDGTFATILKPKTSEIDFPINCDPDLFDGRDLPVFGRLFLDKAEKIHGRGNYASIHWDRVGGWGNSINYRRDHFAFVDHPLTFDQEGRVCIHTKLTHYELFDAFRERSDRLGLFHEAAGMKVYGWKKQPNRPAGHANDGRFFTAALVAGGWHEGSFKPIELGGMDFERMVIGRKSYRISSGNIVAHNEPPTIERVKRALAQTTAYGFACPVQIQYFYTRDRPGYSEDWSWINKPEHKQLWDRYEPANLAIRLAGWEPVTHAVADSDAVQVERFGRGDEVYFTVWGPEPPETVSIDIDAAAVGLKAAPTFDEIVGETEMEVSRSPDGWTLTLPMEANATRVIRIN